MPRTWILVMGATLGLLGGAGCTQGDGDDPTGAAELAARPDPSGRQLFEKATFGGNGRTCGTCHGHETGTLAPAEVEARFAVDPGDPLFRPIDSDDGAGASYERLRHFATILVTLPLPPNVTLADEPGATSVTVERGVLGTLDAPALDPVLMWDGREGTLENQARDAILGHAQAPAAPCLADLQAIARYEQDDLFSSPALQRFAQGGPAPGLPAGHTASEKRGRAFFDPTTKNGLCAQCHAGPMLNQTDTFAFGLPAGARFASVRVSEMNTRGLPVHTYVFSGPSGVTTVTSPDLGRALITGAPGDAGLFRIPSLRGIPADAAVLPRRLRGDARGRGRPLRRVLLRRLERRDHALRAGPGRHRGVPEAALTGLTRQGRAQGGGAGPAA